MVMNKTARPSFLTWTRALALLTVLGLAWLSTPEASAQLGSLVVTITSPTSGSTVGGTIAVSADVTIIGAITVRGVQFKLDGANLGAEDTSGPYSIPWDTRTASNASHTLTAVARDLLGLEWTSDPVTVTVFNDKTPPTVSITSPSSGAAVRATISLNAAASDNIGVVGVQFRLDGANLGAEVTTGPYSMSWNTATASNGSHTLTAVARDAAGNTATSSAVNVTVDNVAPTVTINQAGGQADPTNASPINFTVVFSEAVSGFTSADVTIGGTAGGTKTVTVSGGPGTYNVAVSGMTSGTVIATVPAGVVSDGAGNLNTASTSTDNTVTFNTTPPAVAVTSPASGATVAGTVPVTADASDDVGVVGVQFKLDGANLGAEDTTNPYSVSWNTTTASNGSHTLTAVARDAAGNVTTSAGVTVTVSNDTTPPSVSITSPAGGATVSGTISVTASASDNVGVVGVQFKLDGANLGVEDTTSPYGVSWNTTTASSGSHTLTAVARDAAGNVTTSAGVTVTVSNDTTPPSVSITSPAAGATVSGTISVTASASDNVGVAGVQFKLDGAN